MNYFHVNFKQQCLLRGYKQVAAASFIKEEAAALCIVHLDNPEPEQEIARAAELKAVYGSVWLVFLSSDESTRFRGQAEVYYGQSPYVLYWYVDVEAKKFYVLDGQPDDIMGLKSVIVAALDGKTDEVIPTPPAPPPSLPILTIVLAAINLIMLILMYLYGYGQNPLLVAARFGAIIPARIWGAGEYYRLLTAMFVHFGWGHLFMNLAGMFIFGTRIERYYGKISFLAIYFASGLLSSVASLLLTRGFSAGASGAVYGLVGAAFVYTKMRGSMDLISNHIILIYIIMGLGAGFLMPNVDYFGHIGGLIGGVLVGFIAVKLSAE